MRWLFGAMVVVVAGTIWLAPPVAAQESPNKGLFLSPLRQYIDVNAGIGQQKKLTIANNTNAPIDVALEVEKFSVINYTYDFTFESTDQDWVKLSTTNTRLEPGKSQEIAYSVHAPTDATPGGRYFSIIASTTLEGDFRVRAASVLYITVEGQLDHSSAIAKDNLPFISFGNDIPFTLDVQNTGNNHFFIFLTGHLEGLTAKPPITEAGHILLPGTTRPLNSAIPAPILPGIYKAVYGYKTSENDIKERSKYIVYLPPWAIAVPLGIGIIFAVWRRKRHAVY